MIYRRFPEERNGDINNPNSLLKGRNYYYICLKCKEKIRRRHKELEQDNPSLFKELREGKLTREQVMEGLGDQVFRRPK